MSGGDVSCYLGVVGVVPWINGGCLSSMPLSSLSHHVLCCCAYRDETLVTEKIVLSYLQGCQC